MLMYSLESLQKGNTNEIELKEREFRNARHVPVDIKTKEPFHLQLCIISKMAIKYTKPFCWASSHFHKTKCLTVDFTLSDRSKYWVIECWLQRRFGHASNCQVYLCKLNIYINWGEKWFTVRQLLFPLFRSDWQRWIMLCSNCQGRTEHVSALQL